MLGIFQTVNHELVLAIFWRGKGSGDFDGTLNTYFFLSIFTHTLNRVLNLTNEEVYLQRRLGLFVNALVALRRLFFDTLEIKIFDFKSRNSLGVSSNI